MSDSKMLKARCTKTGRAYGLELKKYGADWKVVNMIDLSSEEAGIIMSEVRQPFFETNKNLLSCVKCGNRRISGCSCSKKLHSCSAGMKYRFDCIYCDSLEIDYSRPMSRTPYTKWAGTSNIPGAIKDRYGNPQGSQYDLAEDGSFVGYKIVVLNLCSECKFDQPAVALRKKGFEVEEYKSLPPITRLKATLNGDKTQLWIISDRNGHMNRDYVELVVSHFNSGHGVYIWGDNDPYYVDANLLLARMFGITMYGNSRGEHVLGIQQAPKGSGIIPNHPITTGIASFYEGITIAEVDVKQELMPLIYGSNGKIVTAYYDMYSKRALVDGGFTRLYYKWGSAGTDRYVVNAAAWLTNIEKFGYNN